MDSETPGKSERLLLHAVADSLVMMLDPRDFQQTLNAVLQKIGESTDVDRVYIFENHWEDERLLCSQTYEWVREGVSAQLAHPGLQNMDYEKTVSPIYPDLAGGRSYAALVSSLEDPLRTLLSEQSILSFILVPIFLEGDFQGWLGCDECRHERAWAEWEIDSLRAVAAGIGSALHRQKIENSMQSRAEELARSHRVALSLMEDAQNAVRIAEEASHAKSSFLAMMSHEIRTPLNGVIGFTDLLHQEPLTPQQRDLVTTIRNCGNSLLGLISDILDLSKIESGHVDVESAPCSPQACLDEVVASFSPAVREKGVELRAEVAPDMPPLLLLDGKRLRQVLFNLIGNAVKFTSEGYVLVELSIITDSSTGHMRLAGSVSDSGIGMAPEEQKVIFEPFEQANRAIHRKFGGSGLGLSICRNLIQAMGGEIEVASERGKGTRFSFSLPTSPAVQASGSEKTAALPEGCLASLRVLVVDDVPTNIRLTQSILRRIGCDIATANDGREAIALVKDREFDVIVMDVLMPVCDGLEATREIRKMESSSGRRAWIIALTADAFADNRARCLDAGMDDFLTKPVRFPSLESALNRAWMGLHSKKSHPPGRNEPPEQTVLPL